MKSAKIMDATSTNTEEFCRSLYLGQVTLYLISFTDSLKNIPTFSIYYQVFFSLHGWSDSNTQPAVLETAALPIELHPYPPPKRECKGIINKTITQTRF